MVRSTSEQGNQSSYTRTPFTQPVTAHVLLTPVYASYPGLICTTSVG